MHTRFAIVPLAALGLTLILAGPTGCSLSASSKSISDTASSPFEWSSDSSGDSVAYQQDVRDYTYAYVRSGGDRSAFQRGIGNLAEQRGVSNWEEDESTCAGIGAGLRKAALDEDQARDFARDLLGDGSGRLRDVQRGYEAGL
jgi:hypothetical protein